MNIANENTGNLSSCKGDVTASLQSQSKKSHGGWKHLLSPSAARRGRSKHKRLAITTIILIITNPSIIHAHPATAESLSQHETFCCQRKPRCSPGLPAWLGFGCRSVWEEDSLSGTPSSTFLAHQWKHLEVWPKALSRSKWFPAGSHRGPLGASVASLQPRCFSQNTLHTRCWWWKENRITFGKSTQTQAVCFQTSLVIFTQGLSYVLVLKSRKKNLYILHLFSFIHIKINRKAVISQLKEMNMFNCHMPNI